MQQSRGVHFGPVQFGLGTNFIVLDLGVTHCPPGPVEFDLGDKLLAEQFLHIRQFFLCLIQHVTRTVAAAGEIGLPRVQQLFLGGKDRGGPLRKLCQNDKVHLAGKLGLQPKLPDFQRIDLILQIVNGSAEFGVLQGGKDLPCFDLVALSHKQFRQNSAFEILDDL